MDAVKVIAEPRRREILRLCWRAERDVEGVGEIPGRALDPPAQAQDLAPARLGEDLDGIHGESSLRLH